MLHLIRNRKKSSVEPAEFRILRLARAAKKISRAEIASSAGLSKTTVSQIVTSFLKTGFLRTTGTGPTTAAVGRKSELLEFDPDAAFVFAIDIELDHTEVAVTNLDAVIKKRIWLTHAPTAGPSEVLPAVTKSIQALASSNKKWLTKAIGVGVGVPGIVDQTTGVLRETDTRRSWEGVDISAIIRKQFHIPVFVENNVKARMLGELIFGGARNVHDAVYLWIGGGIGAGILIDGKVHHGTTSSAGEVGFTLLSAIVKDRRAFPLLYDKQRKLGDIISNTNILRAYCHAKGLPTATIADVVGGDSAGDMISAQIMDEVAELVGFLCVNLVNTINPELIVLGGDLFRTGEKLRKRIERKISTDILSVPASAVRVEHALIQDDGVLLGTVAHVLFDLFKLTRDDPAFPPAHAGK